MNRVDHREAVAFHEAGHAVLDVLTGQRFRYVTLRPRNPAHAGHVMSDCYPGPARWLDEAATLFAGLVAESFYWLDYGADQYDVRRWMVRGGAHHDLRYARWVLWRAWVLQQKGAGFRPVFPIAPGWTPLEMAKAAWERAVWLMAGAADAVGQLAEVLYDSPRAVTWAQAREVVLNAEHEAVSAAELVQLDMLRPWFLDHSRLRWQPSEAWRRRVLGDAETLTAARQR